MHMADALLSPPVAATLYAATAATACISVRAVRKESDTARIPTMAVMAAFVFAGQMVNYAIPGTGASGHLCGGMLLSAVLGPFAGFLSMLVVLAIQCLFFADGGLLALGANCWNMAFYGCFAGYFLFWRPLTCASGLSQSQMRTRIAAASILGCIAALQLGACSDVIETSLSGVTDLPFGKFCMLMQPIHLAIGLVEGLITSSVLLFVHKARPEFLFGIERQEADIDSRISRRAVLVVLAVVAAFIGGGLALLASGNPDGLEWALSRSDNTASETAGFATDEDSCDDKGGITDVASAIQDKTAVLPDYAFPESDSSAGTMVSGLVGSTLVGCVAFVICLWLGLFRSRARTRSSSRNGC